MTRARLRLHLTQAAGVEHQLPPQPPRVLGRHVQRQLLLAAERVHRGHEVGGRAARLQTRHQLQQEILEPQPIS